MGPINRLDDQLNRLKHLSYRTEQTYLGWMRQFYRYVHGASPNELESKHVIDFLTYLATERNVAKATQNLAFNAILFFYRHVLKQDISDLWKAIRSKPKQRIPVVLSRAEVMRLFDQLNGVHRLILETIYGGGLRSYPCGPKKSLGRYQPAGCNCLMGCLLQRFQK